MNLNIESLLIRGFDPYNEEQMRFDASVVLRSSITRLELRLTYVDRNVREFSQLVTRLSSLTLIFCLLSQDQLDLMFDQLCSGFNSLSELAILMPLVNTSSAEENYLTDGLSKIHPETFVSAMSSIRNIKLRETGLTVDQINLFFQHIMTSNVIKSLDIIDKNLSQANVDYMIQAFNSLESLSLHYGTLIGDLQICLFLSSMSVRTNITELSLRNIKLNHINPELLGRAVGKLSSLEIMISDLTAEQLEAIFSCLACKRDVISHLCFSHNDLSSLSPALFVRVARNVQDLDVYNCKITKDQMEGLLRALADKAVVRELNVNYNDLSQVDAQLLAHGLNQLQKAFLYKTELSESQVGAILDHGMKQSQLYHLDLRYNNRRNAPCHLTKYLKSRVYKIEI